MDPNIANYINMQGTTPAQQNHKQNMQAWQNNIIMQHQQQQLLLQLYTYQKLLALQNGAEGVPVVSQTQPIMPQNIEMMGLPLAQGAESLLIQQYQQQMAQAQGPPAKVISPLPQQNMAHFPPKLAPRMAAAPISQRRNQRKSVAELGYEYVETLDSGKVAATAEVHYSMASTSKCDNPSVNTTATITTAAPMAAATVGSVAKELHYVKSSLRLAPGTSATISTAALQAFLAEHQRHLGPPLPTILAEVLLKSQKFQETKSDSMPTANFEQSQARSPIARVPSLLSGYSSAFSPVSSGSSGSSSHPPELSPHTTTTTTPLGMVASSSQTPPPQIHINQWSSGTETVAAVQCVPPSHSPVQAVGKISRKSRSSDEGDDEMFVDVESVEEGPVGKARRNAYIQYYRSMRSIINSFASRNTELHCSLCDQSVEKNDNSISEHVMEHCESGGFRCRICGVEHKQKYKMYAHMREKHEKKSTAFDDRRDMIYMQAKLMECFPKVPTRNNKNELPAVVTKAMKTLPKLIKCSLCEMSFINNKKGITKHAEKHDEILKCSTCGYTSLSLENQNAHQKEHHPTAATEAGPGFQSASKTQILCSILNITEQ